MPRIYVDGSTISLSNKGVGRYAYELTRRLPEYLAEEYEIDVLITARDVPYALKSDPRLNLVRMQPMSDIYQNIIWLPRWLRRRHYDLILKPQESCGIKYGIPIITICHDVQELIDEAAGVKKRAARKLIDFVKSRLKSANLKNSAVVICNSQYTLEAAADCYGFDEKNALVGYCGVDDIFYELSRAIRCGFVGRSYPFTRYILTFATGDMRENYNKLPSVLSLIRTLGCNARLVIGGVNKKSEYCQQLISSFQIQDFEEGVDYQLLDFIGEDRVGDLVELYTEADYYLELSGHEGFGMQLAEAMVCGTTCISSGRGALSEVAAGFDLKISSLDDSDIAAAVCEAYKANMQSRDNASQVGYAKTHYSWDVVADLVSDKIISLCS